MVKATFKRNPPRRRMSLRAHISHVKPNLPRELVFWMHILKKRPSSARLKKQSVQRLKPAAAHETRPTAASARLKKQSVQRLKPAAARETRPTAASARLKKQSVHRLKPAAARKTRPTAASRLGESLRCATSSSSSFSSLSFVSLHSRAATTGFVGGAFSPGY